MFSEKLHKKLSSWKYSFFYYKPQFNSLPISQWNTCSSFSWFSFWAREWAIPLCTTYRGPRYFYNTYWSILFHFSFSDKHETGYHKFTRDVWRFMDRQDLKVDRSNTCIYFYFSIPISVATFTIRNEMVLLGYPASRKILIYLRDPVVRSWTKFWKTSFSFHRYSFS